MSNRTLGSSVLNSTVVFKGELLDGISTSAISIPLSSNWYLRLQPLIEYQTWNTGYAGSMPRRSMRCTLDFERTSSAEPPQRPIHGVFTARTLVQAFGGDEAQVEFASSGKRPPYEIGQLGEAIIRFAGRDFSLRVDLREEGGTKTEVPVHSDGPLLDGVVTKMVAGELTLDTKFVLSSSKRLVETDNGVVAFGAGSKALYANSALLIPCSDYFKALFASNGFSESQDRNLDEDHGDTSVVYDYEADSDLDEEDDARGNESGAATNPNIGFNNRTGKVVVVSDFAYKTWRCFLLYLHLGRIEFAPLKSHRPFEIYDPNWHTMPSAKSIYRLADKLGVDELAAKALNTIKSQLSVSNIIDELFSKFTSWFPSIRDIELEFLFDHWNEVRDSPALAAKAEEISLGAHPHAAPILLAIWRHAKP